MKRAWMAALLLGAALGCDDSTTDAPQKGGTSAQPITLDDRVAFLMQGQASLLALDPGQSALKPMVFPTGKNPLLADRRNGSNEILVLSAGEKEQTGKVKEPPMLCRQDVVGGAKAVCHELPGAYDRLIQSDDGRFALLSYSGTSSAGAGMVVYNPNDLYLFDFAAATPGRSRPLRNLAGKAEQIQFLPRAAILGRERTLVLVSSPNYATVFVADAPAAGQVEPTEITLALTTDGKKSYVLSQAILDAELSALYLLANGSNDVFHVSFDANEAATGNDNDFRATLSLIGAGASPRQMAVYGTGAARRLLVVAPGSRQVFVVNPRTGDSTGIPVSSGPNAIHLFTGASPKDSTQRQRALLLSLDGSSNALAFVDLENIERSQGLAIDMQAAVAGITQLIPLPAQKSVLLAHSSRVAGSALSLVDLEERAPMPMGTTSELGGLVLDPGRAGRAWTSDKSTRLVYLDIAKGAFSPGQVTLDQSIQTVLPLAKASADGQRYVVALHGSSTNVWGATVLRAEQPTRETARSIVGLPFTGYLDRGQP